MKIILVRHGKTVSNVAKTFSEENTQLCKEAYTELLTTKKKLKDFHFEKIYASPLLRTLQTAEVLGFQEPILDKRLQEKDFGDFKGKTYDEALKEAPNAVKDWFADLKHGKPPAGESSFELFSRVSEFLTELSKTNADSLLICHYGTIVMAIAWVLKNFDCWTFFAPVNGGITEIEVDGENRIINKFNF